MLIVSLTGGIASGKSVVAKVFATRGCHIYSADKTAHILMEPEKHAWKKIVSHFGSKILNTDKTIDRSKLGAVIFSDRQEREFLNSVLHPLVLEKRKETIEKLSRQGHYRIFVSEAALAIESGFARLFDKIVVVHCQRPIQIQRLMERDGITKKEALKKIRAQMPARKKLEFADYVIDSSGTIAQTITQAEQVYEHLIHDYKLKLKKRQKRE